MQPSYLQAVRVPVLNAAPDLLATDEEATAAWCKMAGSDPRCSDVIKHLVRLRIGEKVAAPDTSDTEAMKRLQSQGGSIVVGPSMGNGRMCGDPAPSCPQEESASQRSPALADSIRRFSLAAWQARQWCADAGFHFVAIVWLPG